jgi:hypothetical protein
MLLASQRKNMLKEYCFFSGVSIPSCNQKIATWYDAAGSRRGVSF